MKLQDLSSCVHDAPAISRPYTTFGRVGRCDCTSEGYGSIFRRSGSTRDCRFGVGMCKVSRQQPANTVIRGIDPGYAVLSRHYLKQSIARSHSNAAQTPVRMTGISSQTHDSRAKGYLSSSDALGFGFAGRSWSASGDRSFVLSALPVA